MHRFHRKAALAAVACALCAGFALAAPLPHSMTWLEDPSTTATFFWQQEDAGRGTVEYGLTSNYTHAVHGPDGYARHVITVRGLTPGETYHYRVSSTGGYTSGDHTFRTAPSPTGAYRVVVIADTQQPYNGDPATGHSGVVGEVLNQEPDFYVIAGDLVYEGGVWPQWDDFFTREQQLLAEAFFMPLMGNHEVFDTDDPFYWGIFELPREPANERWYSYTVGGTHYVSLNSENTIPHQNEWLARDLQQASNDTNINWIVVFWHRAVYTCADKHGPYQPAKTNWTPIITQYNGDFVFNGHNHNYERFEPIRDVTYIVSGGGGGDLTSVSSPCSLFATTCYHFVSMDIEGPEMHYRAIRSDGLVFDEFSMTNRPRQVRFDPAYPLRGNPVTITYDASQGPLSNESPIYIHLGIDAFAGAEISTAMTFNASSGLWEFDWTVPLSASQRIACVFRDEAASTWDNNWDFNWQALLGRVRVTPDPPVAGSPVKVEYDADLSPLGGETQVYARIGFNRWRNPLAARMPMTPSTSFTWEVNFTVPAHASVLDLAFRSPLKWDNHAGMNWHIPVTAASAIPPDEALPLAVPGSPIIDSTNASQNTIGEAFDFNTNGTPIVSSDIQYGFGDHGKIYVNYDATNFYIGGTDLQLGGAGNVAALFLGFDTLTDDAYTLWHKSSQPDALNFMHNVGFTRPMDIGIVLGDEYGDWADGYSFIYESYDFGQGVYYLSTNFSSFGAMTNAKLSQFDGSGSDPVVTDDDDGDRRTDRWEVCIPWTDLNAPQGISALTNLYIAGVIASSSSTNDNRYLSSVYIGESASGDKSKEDQFAYYFVTIRPSQILLPHGDFDGDSLLNEWEQQTLGSARSASGGTDDPDMDNTDNASEQTAGTDPLDDGSVFTVGVDGWAGDGIVLTWPSAMDREYQVFRGSGQLATNLPATPVANVYTVSTSSADSSHFFIRADKQ